MLVGYQSCLESLVVAGIRKLIDADSIDSHICWVLSMFDWIVMRGPCLKRYLLL